MKEEPMKDLVMVVESDWQAIKDAMTAIQILSTQTDNEMARAILNGITQLWLNTENREGAYSQPITPINWDFKLLGGHPDVNDIYCKKDGRGGVYSIWHTDDFFSRFNFLCTGDLSIYYAGRPTPINVCADVPGLQIDKIPRFNEPPVDPKDQ